MATLIEKLWRCKSANGGRQNNCPPTGPHTLLKKGEFRFKRVSEGAREERERARKSKKDIPSASIWMIVSFSDTQ